MSTGTRQAIVRCVEGLVQEALAGRSDGLTLDRVEFERQVGRWFLRVFLDHPTAVTLEHCDEVARRLGEVLDRVDPIPHAYNLEVSSPGPERPLRRDHDFGRFRGRLATLHLYRAILGRKTVTGRLAGLGPEGEILLELPREGQVGFPRAEVARAHLAAEWSSAGPGSEDRGGGSQ